LFNDDTPLIDHSKERFNKPKTEDAPTSVLRGGADPEEMNTDAVKAEDTEFPEMDADPDTLDKEIDDGIDGGVPLE
jgi:multisite-specific tRNA:(cytosine-C5)-methyltransferase